MKSLAGTFGILKHMSPIQRQAFEVIMDKEVFMQKQL
jgi:hypothetical protein